MLNLKYNNELECPLLPIPNQNNNDTQSKKNIDKVNCAFSLITLSRDINDIDRYINAFKSVEKNKKSDINKDNTLLITFDNINSYYYPNIFFSVKDYASKNNYKYIFISTKTNIFSLTNYFNKNNNNNNDIKKLNVKINDWDKLYYIKIDDTKEEHKQKYLKYKQKYLELKKQLNFLHND
jgi:hypothetical protein